MPLFLRLAIWYMCAICAPIALAQGNPRPGQTGEGQDQRAPFASSDFVNDSYINISGTVHEVGIDYFMLDFAGGLIRVELDDSDRENESYPVSEGDKVVVSGRIDAGLFEQQKIEASSIYLEKLDKHFYASSVDDEDLESFERLGLPTSPAVTIIGQVTEVSEEEFTLNSVATKVIVDVSELDVDLLDEDGVPTIMSGDTVKVTGSVARDFFEYGELIAEDVQKLNYDDNG